MRMPLPSFLPPFLSVCWRCLLILSTLLATTLLTACSNASYYVQSVSGHLALMNAAQPVPQWLADPHTPPALKVRLELAQRMRQFAVTELGLPDNASYRRYADLQRSAVVWNVVAAPSDSLTLKTWCFPVAGCVGYRGYFAETDARALAATLQAQGLEVSVYGVPAYSTLGWMNWAGGDPLLSTFINYPEGELARMLFHELAHQVLYVPNDTVFNESFATAVERLGSAAWLALHASPEAKAEYARHDLRRTQFRALTRATRQTLADIYASKSPFTPVERAQAATKTIAMQDFRDHYATLRAEWAAAAGLPQDSPQFSGYDRWVAQANNAAFGAQAAYDTLVPAFEALYQREAAGQPGAAGWARFFAAVRELGALPAEQRAQALEKLTAQKNLQAP